MCGLFTGIGLWSLLLTIFCFCIVISPLMIWYHAKAISKKLSVLTDLIESYKEKQK